MANIDVSELLTDPDFVEAVIVNRTDLTMQDTGVAAQTVTTFPGVLMSVQPASGQALMLLPEAQRTDGMYEVWTQFELRSSQDNPAHLSDKIIWKGRTLLVTKLDDFQNYGQGYSHALCTVMGTGGVDV